jgi:hypothetical protein
LLFFKARVQNLILSLKARQQPQTTNHKPQTVIIILRKR